VQTFKNVYFADCPPASSGRSSLTLAFGRDDEDIFRAVRHLSSETVRQALGYQSFRTLQVDAQQQDRTVNSFCLAILRAKLDDTAPSDQPYLPGFEASNPIAIDPIQATFNGGRYEPLHEWYPYLEGYSPSFVETVIGHYCPDADSVFDPFGGAGTTPLTAARLGKTAYYSEINPVLQFLTDCKVLALRLTDKQRGTIVSRLRDCSDRLDALLNRAVAELQLRQTYRAVFGNSVFFDDDVFEDILRLRTVVDEIACADPATARFLTVAVLKSLIPASRLIRRGDVRFKTAKELSRGRPELRELTRAALKDLARDIEALPRVEIVPLLLLENAKNLGKLPPLGAEAVITSPPYLNGTNYFRNTKVELWFLRCLHRNEDLAQFRFQAMTVGINDVTVRKPVGEMPPSAVEVLKVVGKKAYDPRIPLMIACFASEMHTVLRDIAGHMKPGGKIIIDIGDSAYAGVRVPTDRFIVESLAGAGFQLTSETVLRQRYSRNQMKLSQRLLVFDQRTTNRNRKAKRESAWVGKWEAFKADLPHQKGDYAKRNWGHALHSLCSYQGKMKPSLAAHLVETFTTPGAKMVDPFSGVGTIPFEAALHAVESWAFDISPPAVHITKAKIEGAASDECETLLTALEKHLKSERPSEADKKGADAIRFNGPLLGYFEKTTFNEVLLARRYFLDHSPSTPSESLVFACLLHILHGNRPYALSRRSHPITPFAPTGPAEYRALIPRLRDKVERSLACLMPPTFRRGHSLFQDATEWWPAEVKEIDAVITSPPFFDSTRFYMGNWMRLWFSGWEAADFQQRPMAFVDQRQKQSFEVYHPILRQCRERLKTGGVVVFHLGESRKCDMAEELARIAKTWFRIADVYTESVTHCESHGIRDKGTVVSHQYLVLE
jgi:RMKL-like, methyltransferase domain